MFYIQATHKSDSGKLFKRICNAIKYFFILNSGYF